MDDWALFPVKDEQIEICDRKCKTSLKNIFAQQVHKNTQVKFVLSEEKLRIHSHLIIAI